MNPASVHALMAFLRTRYLAHRLRTRGDVERWRAARLRAFLRNTAPSVDYYAGIRAGALDDLPLMDKATLLANFERLNTAGVSLAAARQALDVGDPRIGGLLMGQSTGTSGNRGVFVISEAERFTWMGVLLAKTLPDALWSRHRVALAMPGAGELYATAIETGRVTLRFFSLSDGIQAWRDDMRAFSPDVLVAPPKVLRSLAEGGGLRPRQVFSGGEVLDPLDRQIIEAGFGATVREIYMATEGLFGVGCPHGALHLAEDVVAFEWEPAGETGLVTPRVTDFTRRTQVMARYRMNDLLRLDARPCACGSPLQRVTAVEGRQDDVFQLPRAGGAGLCMVTPDVARNAVVDADRRILDFRVVQTGPDAIDLQLAHDLPAEAAEAAREALTNALARAGAGPVAIGLTPGLSMPSDRKLRRVRREWTP
jgi:putative adenylate-forming enzyme